MPRPTTPAARRRAQRAAARDAPAPEPEALFEAAEPEPEQEPPAAAPSVAAGPPAAQPLAVEPHAAAEPPAALPPAAEPPASKPPSDAAVAPAAHGLPPESAAATVGAVAEADHRALLQEAIRIEAGAQQALLRGDAARSRAAFQQAADRYRASWEAAPPRSFGRLVGMVKAGVLAGHGGEEAAYVRRALPAGCDSPPGCYALALAALVQGDDDAARDAAGGMRTEDPAFNRTAAAIDALAREDADGYAAAVRGIVDDFEARDAHLTGVPFADTAVVLERLAAARRLAARPASALMPVLG